MISKFEALSTQHYFSRPIESETSKIVENSYRATTLAFLNEWSLFAERNGVDLIKVINRFGDGFQICPQIRSTQHYFSPARGSAATASPRTAAWASGPTRP